MQQRQQHRFLILLLAVSFLPFWGCSQSTTPKAQPPKPVLKGDDVVVARVNGSPITRYELNQEIRSALGPGALGQLDAAGKKKVLDSLVTVRAIAQTEEKSLSPLEQAALKKKVAAYRDQLLVRQYLAAHGPVVSASMEQVRAFYERHPDRFGAKTIRSYEMISSHPGLKPHSRDRLLHALKDPQKHNDWQTWAEILRREGYPVTYHRGEASPQALQPRLRDLLQSLKKGETSRVVLIQGAVYIARITGETRIPPRPLNQVSAEIRRILAPVQLRDAVRKLSEEVLKKSVITYEKGNSKF